MKLWTNSSIHTCQARLFRGDGSFLVRNVALGEGEGVSSGVAVASGALGDGVGETGSGLGDACAVMIGATLRAGRGEGLGVTALFFADRVQIPNASAAIATAAQEITNAGRVATDFFSGAFVSALGSVARAGGGVEAVPATSSTGGPSNSLMAATSAGICFESG